MASRAGIPGGGPPGVAARASRTARPGRGAPWQERLASAGAYADVVVLVLAGCGIVLQALNRHTPAPGVQDFRAQECVAAVAFGVGGLILLQNRTAVALGWTATATAVTQGVAYFAGEYGIYVLGTSPGGLPWGSAAVWLSAWFGQIGYWLIPVMLLLLPDGRLRSARWRAAAALALAGAAASALGWATAPYRSLSPPIAFAGLTNPAALPAQTAGVFLLAGGLAGAAAAAAALAGLALRYRSADHAGRQQLKWVALAGAATAALMACSLALGSGLAGDALLAVAFVPLPAGAAVAAMRYRLWGIGLVVNRALLYGLLTAGTLALYVAAVLVLDGLLRLRLGAPLAAVAAALGAQPIRARLQRWADRRLYGARGEPYAALASLGQVLHGAAGADDLLDAVAATIASALRLPFAGLSVAGVVVAWHGVPAGTLESFPMSAGGVQAGDILVARRLGEERFSGRDRRLLDELSRQVAAAIQNGRLTRDLRRSRERLITAREEERRRIRGDLHDELGPQLAGTALQLDRVRLLLSADPASAEGLLGEQSARLRHLVTDVRRLVHGLRPPALDDLGLAGALADQASRLSSPALAIDVHVAGPGLGPLPAAVEAAAYRIASEAMANAARHAGARTCQVRLTRDREFRVEVQDDGGGMNGPRRGGVGLRSMRDRAEELGGTLAITCPPGGGTLVRACLPVAP